MSNNVTSRLEHRLKLEAPTLKELLQALLNVEVEDPWLVQVSRYGTRWHAEVIWHVDIDMNIEQASGE